MTDSEKIIRRADRRDVLTLMNALGIASLAGCLSGDDGTADPSPTGTTEPTRSTTNAPTTTDPTANPTTTTTAGPTETEPPAPELPERFEATDGFETDDYRNFAPLYVGEESNWIRPQATTISEDPVAGDHSLLWTANSDPHRWALVSNAFQLNPPVEASVSVRIDDRRIEEYAAGIAIAESQNDAAVLRTTFSGLELATGTWDGDAVDTADAVLPLGSPRELSIELDGGTVTGTLSKPDGTEVATLSGEADLEPNAIALYVDTAAGAETAITFDDVSVTGQPYRVRNDEWTRAHPFVVLPRKPDLGQDQGNWVGGQDVLKEDGTYEMWYRIRSNQGRGQGFGYARSENGYDWEKAIDENPVHVPDYGQASMEGITVLKIDGTYHAWYCMDVNGTWEIAHMTSPDGIDWTDRGIVIDGYAKDPMATYLDGTYYLAAIAPSGSEFSIYTSTDGMDWTRENTMPLPMSNHSHPEIYYVEETETFWLYAFVQKPPGGPTKVRSATSEDGIEYGELTPTWTDPPVGIDHRPIGGIDYGSALTDGEGHLPHHRRVPMYYQSRHNYENNTPEWEFTGDGVVTLAGRFSGLFEGIPTSVEGTTYEYREFPLEAPSIAGLDAETTDPATVTVDSWAPTEATAAVGSVRARNATDLTLSASTLQGGTEYVLDVGGTTTTATSDADGTASLTLTLPADTAAGFELTRQ